MVKKVLNNWQRILQVMGWIGAVAATVKVLWVLFTLASDVKSTKESVTTIEKVAIPSINDKISTLSIQMDNYAKESVTTRNAMVSLNKSYIEYIKKDDRVTKEDFTKLTEGLYGLITLELKKNEWQIPLAPSN